MAHKYILKVTAGPNYDEQNPVPVNSEESIHIANEHLTARLKVRVQNYRGLPEGSPQTSPYFETDRHKHDLYSLAFHFTPKDDINGHDLVFGNDFDHPIRDKLPPGFNQAFKIATWFIDPGLYGDVYAEEPYLYSPLLSSMNVLRIGPKGGGAQEQVEDTRTDRELLVLEEGADGDGEEVRKSHKLPDQGPARQKFFLTEQKLKDFTFEKGREYSNDFFNPYLDFNEFSLKLPGFSVIPGITIPIISFWDGQPLRYVLKNRVTNEPLFVVIFSLLPKDGEQKCEEPAAAAAAAGEKPVQSTGAKDDDLD